MWTRQLLKENARKALSKYYPQAFLVSLVIAAATGAVTVRHEIDTNYESISEAVSQMDPQTATTVLAGVSTAGFFAVLLRLLIGNALEVGGRRFYVQSRNRQESAGLGALLEAFQSGRYGNLVIVMAMRDIICWLFTLLLIIPGIIKRYEYLMVPYILSDDPTLSWDNALARSKYLMYGHKMDAFVLQLSFLLWYIIGAILPAGIGVYFVNPYMDATMAEFYTMLKETTPDYEAYA